MVHSEYLQWYTFVLICLPYFNITSEGIHINFQETDISKNTKCTMAPESRFDCARDRLLNQRECEERGCCYVPLPNTAGPPWCFYPSWCRKLVQFECQI
uniref:P-type domain-containing protein n=1 Tax=Monopterus albus TaxID=43700 RepID=A0A3Q3Q031_MONAL